MNPGFVNSCDASFPIFRRGIGFWTWGAGTEPWARPFLMRQVVHNK